MGAAKASAAADRAVEWQGDDVDTALAQLLDHARIVGIDDHAAFFENKAVVASRSASSVETRCVPVAQGHRQAVDKLRRAPDQQARLDQRGRSR